MRRPRLTIAAAAVVVAAGAAATAVDLWPSARPPASIRPHALAVFDPRHNRAGVAMPHVPLGQAWIYDLAYPLCVTMDGTTATVTGVEGYRPDGAIQVVDWSDGPPASRDGVPGRAGDLPTFAHDPVTWRCGAAGHGLTVGVVLGSSRATAHGFVVHSDAGDVIVPFEVTECVAGCPP